MDSFRDAVFFFEAAALPPELQIANAIMTGMKATPNALHTLFQRASTLEEAAAMIDRFKAKTCGSAYTLAVININMFGTAEELEFLLRGDVLGDPRTLFLASIRSMTGAVYTYAKNKIQRESELWEGAPSCLDCYGASNKQEAVDRTCELIPAFLKDAEDRTKTRHHGKVVVNSAAQEALRKYPMIFTGNRGKSGLYRAVDVGAEMASAKVRETGFFRRGSI